ncbi:MAG: GH106 [uncultured Segetibacter sp.]|uniref:GH106 n=1 Tax=uncultured Segetibacter sp. TaxID=481133 RepID=A0A6J4RNE8_9BACT|nr:MAG: GH106 [uncultured Segetibacter sp.]
MRHSISLTSILILFFCSIASAQKNYREDTLLKGFISPPNSAMPRVWWHWMNGNITKYGIRKDLEWMHRTGIGGFQNFDAALATPQIVEKRLTYMTPEWKDAFQLTTKLADSLHLEMAIAGSPGWSESGGPWVKPEDGMKKMVWSETRVKSGASNINLAKPPAVTGPFQNIPKQPGFNDPPAHKELPGFYKDILVVAHKLPNADIALNELKPVVTSSGGNFKLAQLTDGDLGVTTLLPSDTAKGYAWIQFAFAQPQTVKAITMVGGGNKGPFGLFGEFKDTRSLEISDDGDHFKWVCYIPAGNVLQQTVSIPAATSKLFRITIKNPPAPFSFGAIMGGGPPPKAPAGTGIAEIVLHTASRINMFEEKAAFAPATDLYTKATAATEDVIATKDIIDVTNKLNEDGTLNWTVPKGNWNIVRFGYSLLGINNHPASPEATGFEVDKLDSVAVKKYFVNYLDQYKSAAAGLMGKKDGLQFMVTDSWEAGAQNWTSNIMNEFQKRRGYNMLLWMPVLTGHIVKSSEASEQFLWDFRKTLSDLVAEYHYDQLTSILQQYGMKRYSESHEDRRAMIADGMEVKRKAAVPMSAMWTPSAIMVATLLSI